MLQVKDAVEIIANEHPHGISLTRLLKLLWLAELRHFETTGERLTDANWFRYDHGPFSKDVLNTAKKELTLESAEVNNQTITMLHSKKDPSIVVDDRNSALKDTIWIYNKYSFEDMLKELYEDPFFKDTPYGSDGDFSQLPKYREIDLTDEQVKEICDSPTSPVNDLDELFDELEQHS